MYEADGGGGSTADWLVSTKVLWANALILMVVMFALLPIIDNGYIALPDEGLYSAQAQNLANGSWRSDRPAPDIDDTGQLDSLAPSKTFDTTDIPYANHPLYPLALTLPYKALGKSGQLAVSVISVWASAVFSALLARRFDRRYGLPALWLTALGTPLVFSAYVVMAHSLAAAAAAALVLTVTLAVEDHRFSMIPLTLVSTAALVLVRSEGILVAAAVGGVVGLMALPWRGRKLDLASGSIAAAVLVTGAGTFLIEQIFVSTLVGTDGRASVVEAAVDRAGPASAAWISLLKPWDSGLEAKVQVLLILVCTVLGALTLRIRPTFSLLPLALWALAAAAGVLTALTGPSLISGLVPAFPLLVVPVLFTTRTDLGNPLFQRLAGVTVLVTIAIVFTTYADGGATQWGGRFYHVLIPLAVPLVLLGVTHALGKLEPSHARFAGACLVIVAVSISISALQANRSYRNRSRSVVTETIAVARDWDDGRQIVLFGRNQGDGLSRTFWEQRDSYEILHSGGLGGVMPLIAQISTTDINRVVLISDIDAMQITTLGEDVLPRAGWEVTDTPPRGDSGLYVLDVRPVEG
ncbi:MAG: hypothetical protein ACK5O2_16790 [Microthrixaceae bacterium]